MAIKKAKNVDISKDSFRRFTTSTAFIGSQMFKLNGALGLGTEWITFTSKYKKKDTIGCDHSLGNWACPIVH